MSNVTIPRHFLSLLAPLALLCACGEGGSSSGSSSPSNPTPNVSVAVNPASSNITATDPLAVTVAITGATGGTANLTSGAYTSAPVTIAGGQANITVPAGVLAIGADTLTATYQPPSGSAVSGAATVSVAAAPGATVTASSTYLATNGHPFAALPVGGGLIVSVTANTDAGSSTGLRVFAGASPAGLAFKCFQPVAFPNAAGTASAFGLAATPNGAGLALAIENAGIALLDRNATFAGCSGTPIPVSQGALSTGQGSFDVAITPDGRYAFVANEYGVAGNDSTGAPIQGNIGVVALSYDANGVPTGGQLAGRITTGGNAIAGVTVSPDGTRLYVTSEIAQPGATVSGTGNPVLAHGGCSQATGQPTTTYGLLSVIDVAKAETAPGPGAIVRTIAAGCSPVRTVETADGEVLWLAARGDNRVLAFATRTLESNPDAALLGYADTGGTAPVGLALFAGGRLLAVANSNRFAAPATVGNLTILQAVPVQPRLVQTAAASFFPRSLSVAADGSTLFLTNYNGGSVQVIATTTR